MAGDRAAIFGQFIEGLAESEVSSDDRRVVYDVLLEVLEEFDIKGMETYIDVDWAFEEAWYRKYPELEEEEE
jgi:hypothetical protein